MRVVEQLRQVGPLLFVVDDVQWADQDTRNVLDYLQTAPTRVGGNRPLQGFGIITVSRTDADRQVNAPDDRIRLEPLHDQIVMDAIREEAQQQGLLLNDSQIDAVVKQIDGLPYRLQAYLTELAPTGLLAVDRERNRANHVDTPSIEQVWQHRENQLPTPIEDLFHLICVAGREVTVSELSPLHGDDGSLDTCLDVLVEKRLIVRDGGDGPVRSHLARSIVASSDRNDVG